MSTLLHKDASERSLIFFIRAIFGVWFITVLFDPLSALAGLPLSLFEPTGFFLKWLPSGFYPVLLTPVFLWGFKAAMLLSTGTVAAGRLHPALMAVSAVLLTLYQALLRSFGQMNHGEIVILYAVYFIVLFAWADRAAGRRVPGLPMVATLAFFLLTYVSTGIYRLANGGLDLFFSDTMQYWTVNQYKDYYSFSLHVTDWLWHVPYAAASLKVFFPAVTLVEITAPFCLVSRRFRVFFIVFMGSFHLLCWLVVNVIFWHNVLLFALLFDWKRFDKVNSV